MAWVHLLGRKFADVLTDSDFDLLLEWPYWNRFGQQGHCYYGSCHDRRFCISQSRRDRPDTTENLERVSNIDDLDSGAPLRPDFKAFAGIAGTYRGIFETRSSKNPSRR